VQLPIGDIMFKNNNGEICVIIERKTLSDLASSIIDGRKNDQLNRLSNFSSENPNVKIIYLVENSSLRYTKIPKSTLLQAVSNMMIRDGIFIIMSDNISDTVNHLTRIKKSLISKKRNPDGVTHISKCYKKSNSIKNPNDWFKCCISIIPTLGPKSASMVYDKYKTPSSLIDAISNGIFDVMGLGSKKINTIKQYFI